MKTYGKILATSSFVFASATFAHAHPGHDGHELTWSFLNHGLWDSPLVLFIGALLASAAVFRLVSRRN
ncbi:MAG: hypothetical protein IPP19_11735 [Verrucomicrobia bacterium]|nr:hypothetical protein [Verrucomicrobiota bacterium]